MPILNSTGRRRLLRLLATWTSDKLMGIQFLWLLKASPPVPPDPPLAADTSAAEAAAPTAEGETALPATQGEGDMGGSAIS